MKYLLVALSIACLSFTFTRDFFEGNKESATANVSAAPDNTSPATPIDGGKTGSVSSVVTAALAFKASLSASQQATLEQTYTTSLARKWSNLPCGSGCRNGIQFGSLSSAQLQLAQAVIREATGTTANDGFDEWEGNRMAEAYLHANGGGSGYDSTLRWIAFLNTPSATGQWMLQFGGHHFAGNIAFNNGHVVGATPYFQGIEPLSFSFNGKSFAPLNDDHDALAAMLASLSSSELSTAKLSTTFSDCTMVPGETNGGNGTFPATKVGIPCSALTTAQKALVLAAIQHYVQDIDATTAAAVMTRYTNEIDGTYISYTGNGTSGTATSFLNANSNYVRIDGPTVWIELACQNGVVLSGIHYHTVWRDHSHDYGLDLSGPAIDGTGSSTAVAAVASAKKVVVYPNPAGEYINAAMPDRLKAGTINVVSTANGQVVLKGTNYSGTAIGVNVAKLPAGAYILRVEDGGNMYTGTFTKL